MMRAGVFRWLLVLAAVVAGGSQMAAKDRWFSARTEHFEVLTNARQSDARLLVGRLEEFRENFLEIMPGPAFREPRTTVVIFDGERDFRPYKPLYNGKPKENIAGVFQGSPDEVVIAMTAQGEIEETIATIYHEYIHLLMHARGFRLPPWLNEGIAQLFETMEFSDDGIRVGRHNPIHVMLLNRTRLMPLAQLFSITHQSSEYNEGDRRGLFYAQSWAFVHFCRAGTFKGKNLEEMFGRLVELMSLGYPAERCMQEAFGMSLEEVEKELGAYVRGGRYQIRRYRASEKDYAAGIAFRPATDFERDVTLANLKWRMQRNGDATYRMLQFAKQEPASARPYEVLGAIAMSEGERRTALDYWLLAAAKQSENAYIYEQLARDSLRQYMAGVSLNFRLPENAVTELRGWLDRAIALSPDYAEAWEWLTLTEAFAKKPRVDVVNAAVGRGRLLMGRPRFLVAIALLALGQGDHEAARGIVEGLLKRPDVLRVSSRATTVGVVAGNLKTTGGKSWMLEPEYYPDVQAIAKALRRRLQKEKPARDDVFPEPVASGPDE